LNGLFELLCLLLLFFEWPESFVLLLKKDMQRASSESLTARFFIGGKCPKKSS
jgi:hypothetical protein